MTDDFLPREAAAAAETLQSADVVIGIPSFQNARTIQHVVRAVDAGLSKYMGRYRAVIINSDGGSTDGTQQAVLSAHVEDGSILLLSHRMTPAQRLSVPYTGIPGKGSAFRLVFQMAAMLKARACAVVDADLRSITPEWIDLLLRPVLHAGYDFVAPYYHRHKYDGTITNSIVYPLTRALYGMRVRQPIGGDFGMSNALFQRYLDGQDWETDVARYGIDIWMTTIAMAEGFRVCQSFLGAKLHDAKDPGTDLSAMLEQVVGSVFHLMERYEPVWSTMQGSRAVELFGFRYDVGLDPIAVDVERMLTRFRRAHEELHDFWASILRAGTTGALERLASEAEPTTFYMADGLWARIVYDFACAYMRRVVDRRNLLRSLTPLYLARVASFVLETQSLSAAEVEEKIENLCRCYEALKPELVTHWTVAADGTVPAGAPSGPVIAAAARRPSYNENANEVAS